MPPKTKSTPNKKKPSTSATIKQLSQDLFSQLGFPKADVKVKKAKKAEAKSDLAEVEGWSIQVAVSPEDSGVLIGYHGETISALQLILSLMAHQRIGEWYRLSLNINDYRERREQVLVEMAKNAAERVKATQEELIMPPMASFDRRTVHLTLAKEQGVRTESVGEGRDRRLIVYPDSAKGKSDLPKASRSQTK